MQIIGEKVKHISFGKGIITNTEGDYISAYFDQIDAEKKFLYPESFEKFLAFESVKLQEEALIALARKVQKKQEEKTRKLEEQNKKKFEHPIPIQTVKSREKARKLPPRKNLAFKLNYCDGGATQESIGFKAVCSDEIIHYNIEKAKRSWCSFKDCP